MLKPKISRYAKNLIVKTYFIKPLRPLRRSESKNRLHFRFYLDPGIWEYRFFFFLIRWLNVNIIV